MNRHRKDQIKKGIVIGTAVSTLVTSFAGCAKPTFLGNEVVSQDNLKSFETYLNKIKKMYKWGRLDLETLQNMCKSLEEVEAKLNSTSYGDVKETVEDAYAFVNSVDTSKIATIGDGVVENFEILKTNVTRAYNCVVALSDPTRNVEMCDLVCSGKFKEGVEDVRVTAMKQGDYRRIYGAEGANGDSLKIASIGMTQGEAVCEKDGAINTCGEINNSTAYETFDLGENITAMYRYYVGDEFQLGINSSCITNALYDNVITVMSAEAGVDFTLTCNGVEVSKRKVNTENAYRFFAALETGGKSRTYSKFAKVGKYLGNGYVYYFDEPGIYNCEIKINKTGETQKMTIEVLPVEETINESLYGCDTVEETRMIVNNIQCLKRGYDVYAEGCNYVYTKMNAFLRDDHMFLATAVTGMSEDGKGLDNWGGFVRENQVPLINYLSMLGMIETDVEYAGRSSNLAFNAYDGIFGQGGACDTCSARALAIASEYGWIARYCTTSNHAFVQILVPASISATGEDEWINFGVNGVSPGTEFYYEVKMPRVQDPNLQALYDEWNSKEREMSGKTDYYTMFTKAHAGICGNENPNMQVWSSTICVGDFCDDNILQYLQTKVKAYFDRTGKSYTESAKTGTQQEG